MITAEYTNPPLRDPGQFHFVEVRSRDENNHVGYDITGMVFICPCGCGNLTRLSFTQEILPVFLWDANKISPTITPSTPVAPCGNSYWVTNGEFIPVET